MANWLNIKNELDYYKKVSGCWYKKSLRMIPKKTIKELISKQGEQCDYCGTILGLEIHHKKRRSLGVSDDIKNLVILCHKHHADVHRHYRDWTKKYRIGIGEGK